MVRMVGIRSISLSRLFDDGFRLTHPTGARAQQRVNDRRCVRQPALIESQLPGSTRPPLIHTSKCRWFAVERPVLPT